MCNDSLTARQSSGNLNFSTAQKMIDKLLTCNRIQTREGEGKVKAHRRYDEPKIKARAFTKEELAKKLDISIKELDSLKTPSFYKTIVNKISPLLIYLYCSTKFVDDEYKS